MNNIRRLAFIGGGNMAAALIGGLTKRGLPGERSWLPIRAREQLRTPDARLRRSRRAGQRQRRVTAPRWSMLAVKPQQMRAVALASRARIWPHSKPLIISVAAGIPHAALARWFGPA